MPEVGASSPKQGLGVLLGLCSDQGRDVGAARLTNAALKELGYTTAVNFSTQFNSSGWWGRLEVAMGQGSSRSHIAAQRDAHVQLSSELGSPPLPPVLSKDAIPK